ncbi:MAG: replication and repair protein RecF [Bacteriovoracaceae bacterium]|nr:replication and repair protein RecF [Bacteriovoracaceae bacterium]
MIIGPNAQGKTSILESLSLVTTLASFRTHKTSEMISGGESQASVTAELSNPTRSKVVLGLGENKKFLKVDNKEIPSKSKYPFLGSSVSFSPDDLYLIKGSAEQRRLFLDELGVSLDPGFSKILQRFDQVLKQRNKLLKSIKNGRFLYEEYSLWTEKFVEAAIPVYEGRLRFVKILNDCLPKIYSDLFQTPEALSIEYQHSLSADELIAEALFKKINQLGEAERAIGHSLVGPHRDDFQIKINQFSSRTYGSQGQIRGIVIALKVAQLELTRANRNWSPILLLDDIVSELDDRRVKALINYLTSYPGQLFVTTAEVDKVKALHSQFSGFKIIDLAAETRPFSFTNNPQIEL